jgi:hypothetical protein
MEVVIQPGTALLLEPGGLDAPSLKDRTGIQCQKQLQPISGGFEKFLYSRTWINRHPWGPKFGGGLPGVCFLF